jgi:non-heme Fe2+,alpha-ketoglutarate-dependent halogenase
MGLRHLSEEQKTFYRENGYLLGLPSIYGPQEVASLNEGFLELKQLLKPHQDTKEIREWHESSRWLYNICSHPQIVAYVSGILGPNFYLWASNFFAKAPRTQETVGWHQDAYYWPLYPHNSVTVWLAFTDVDAENGAMQVVPKSHRSGIIKHQRSSSTNSVLTLELEEGVFNASDAISLSLKAGQMSLHDDNLIHGSPANHSDRWRIGLTMRYSGTNVKCDMTVNPHFRAYLMSGVDEYQYNPQGVIPEQEFGSLDRQHLSHEEAGTEPDRLQ